MCVLISYLEQTFWSYMNALALIMEVWSALTFSALKTLKKDQPMLFGHLTKDCNPVVMKIRKDTQSNKDYIKCKVNHLLMVGIVESSNSSWQL